MPVLICVLIGCISGCLATSQSDGWGPPPPVPTPMLYVTGSHYQVPSVGLGKEKQDTAHRETLDFLEGQAKSCMGYQCDLNMPQYEKTLPPYIPPLS